MADLEKLVEIKVLRDIWPHEALDFTPWLAEEENIALLGDAVGLEITVEETESSVGDFNVDIFASETGTDRKIIIENQLEETNHDHLGKLITYAAGKSADIIIWVVKHAREEHRAAIEWLNNYTDDRIGFFCEIKLYKIGNSKPAVKFEVIERPNDWAKEVKKDNSSASPFRQAIYDYWIAFNDHAFKNKDFSKNFNQRKPNFHSWMNYSMGSSGYCISLTQVRSREELGLELYISDDKVLFNSLLEHKSEIENQSGLVFDWQALPEKKASRILITKPAQFDEKSQWAAQFDWIMDTMIKMKTTFKEYL